MYLLHLFLVLLCVYESQPRQDYYGKKFDAEKNAKFAVNRIMELMRSYYEEANSRIYQLNNIRFMYEESPYYEMGFIIGEIIERYRKVLEMVQRPHRFHWYRVPDTLKLVEYTQKLYFELYHLVRMIHETPRKWSESMEFFNIEKVAGPETVAELAKIKGKLAGTDSENQTVFGEMSLKELLKLKKIIAEQEKIRSRDKKKRKKQLDKLRQAYMKGMIKEIRMKDKPYNRHWPIDYGWEIDTDW